ncbi:hypothetical protein Y032_0600g498 [Ancylostoma ceylanicum]|nr:hypothetical protein Y032_0600g498 [Ancylostoma ceylanicum]
MLECLNDWTLAIEKGEGVDIVYFDFAKAFDRVSHSKLLRKTRVKGAHKCMDLEDGARAAMLRYSGNEGPSNIVLALESREKYGRRKRLSRTYRADITLSKLKFYSKFFGYNYKMLRWEEFNVPREPFAVRC